MCDVYDALDLTRVYRDAWSESDAIAFLRDGAGTGFDERCVEALARVVGRDQVTQPAEPATSLVPQPAL